MQAYWRNGEVEYSLTPLSKAQFLEAFCSEFEVDGKIVRTIKALKGYPSFFVPEDRSLLWPLPPKDLEIVFEEDDVPYEWIT
jgi:hypothetical protein